MYIPSDVNTMFKPFWFIAQAVRVLTSTALIKSSSTVLYEVGDVWDVPHATIDICFPLASVN